MEAVTGVAETSDKRGLLAGDKRGLAKWKVDHCADVYVPQKW